MILSYSEFVEVFEPHIRKIIQEKAKKNIIIKPDMTVSQGCCILSLNTDLLST